MQLPLDTPLTPADQTILSEELDLHQRVKLAVREEALAASPDMNVIQTRLKELRDEAISASEGDLPSLFQQLYTHHSLASRSFEKKLPDMRAPYFAHIRLLEDGKSRDILIGYQTFINAKHGITIIDWRHAALAKVFFNNREGDDFEIQLPGRWSEGILKVRRIITFETGELTGIAGPTFSLLRNRSRSWDRIDGDGLPKLSGGAGQAVSVNQFGTGASSRKLPDVSALLDTEQYAILSQEDRGALLILGGAGSGKTTVALHRMALLAYQKPRYYHPKLMRVVVPEQGLVRLTQRLLKGLALDGVGAMTFDAWASQEGKHILKGLPRKTYEWTPPSVVFIKRHPAMMRAVDVYVEKLTQSLAERAQYLIGQQMPRITSLLTDSGEGPLWQRLTRCEQIARKIIQTESAPERTKDLFEQFIKEAKGRILDVENARGALYTDPELHHVLTTESQGAIKNQMILDLIRHTKKQFEASSSDSYDEETRDTKAVDGVDLEEDDYAGTLDVEDYAVLLYLMKKIHGIVIRKGKSVTKLHHLVIDEAQDLAALELKLLGQTLESDATLTVAGDAVQQSDTTVMFRGWDDALAMLDVGTVEETRLTTNYRCPRPVAELGHKVLGPLAPTAMPKSLRDGQDVTISTFPNEGLAMIAISEALYHLMEKEHLASVAIICENEENAQRFYEGLANLDQVRLVTDGEFEFKPGIDVTDVSQVKGLEFDYVIIPDANLMYYPDTAVARRTLHIAITRAVHQLWVIAPGKPSDIII
jgi:DNA helicase-2/ATP-dependent DNA helicase PcrA